MDGSIDADILLRRVPTAELAPSEIGEIRALLAAAFGSDEHERFTDDDWDHAVGGIHFVLSVNAAVLAHASVVERELHVGDHRLRTGYVEAVSTASGHQGAGLGSLVMADVTAYVRERFELGALGTGRWTFYERLGWQRWAGPSSVRVGDTTRPTPDDDGFILVLLTRSSPPLDPASPISCDWRPGDVW